MLWQLAISALLFLFLPSTGFFLFAPRKSLNLAVEADSAPVSDVGFKAINLQVLNSAKQPLTINRDMKVILSSDTPGLKFDNGINGSFTKERMEITLKRGTDVTTFFCDVPYVEEAAISVKVKRGLRWKTAKLVVARNRPGVL